MDYMVQGGKGNGSTITMVLLTTTAWPDVDLDDVFLVYI